MSLTYQELIDLIETNPSGVREALELVKRQLASYPSATSADDGDTLALSKDDGSGTTQALSVATLLLRAVENNGGAVSFESGTLANRAAAGTDGAWYFATDEAVLYRDDGSDWNAIIGNTSLVEQATDTGTDEYTSGVNTTPPAAGYTVRRDFQSANETTTPTLDTLTITTRDGSALWADALSGVHDLQLNAGGTAWLCLDPNPVITDSTNKTGVDNELVSGTAGIDGNLAQWNADGDAVDSGVSSSIVTASARIETGTYTGDGTTAQGITGIGFKPKAILIYHNASDGATVNTFFKADSAINALFIRGTGSGDNTVESNRITSFDSDGFTVSDDGVDSDPNTNGRSYSYMAIG